MDMMKNRHTFLLLTTVTMILVLMTGCGAKTAGTKSSRAMAASAKVVSPTASFGAVNASYADYAVEESFDMAAVPSPDAAGGSQENEAAVERKLIRNGSLTLEVENLDEAEQTVLNWGTSLGGHLQNSIVGL